MDHINEVVAENFKHLREQKNLSLDAVAKLSGVSKSMLGQIERGTVNPTITTVWKIAMGLKISFTELVNPPQAKNEVIQLSSLQPLLEDKGHYRNFPVITFDDERRFELYYIELDSGSYLQAEAHPAGTQEFITVFSSELTVTVNEKLLIASSGDCIRFEGDFPHQYRNSGKDMCKISMIIYYPNSN